MKKIFSLSLPIFILMYWISWCGLLYAADIEAVLDDNSGASAFSVKDSSSVERCHIDSNGNTVIKGGLRLDVSGVENTTPESLIVDGNVGIGTTGPAFKLDVAGTFSADSININDAYTLPTTDGSANQVFYTNGSGIVGWTTMSTGTIGGGGSANHVSKFTGASTLGDSLIYDDGASIGIGSTSPSALLDVAGTASLRGAAGITGLYVNASGFVGVGTTGPGAFLTVGNNLFQVNSSGNLAKINNVGYTWPSIQGGASTVLANDGSGGLLWASTATAGGWTDDAANVYLTTTSDSVGIGTTAPNVKLHVVGDGSYSAAFMSGNVGIGTTSPGAKLEVNGAIKITDGAQGTGKVLTSDANGLASWATAASGTVTGSGTQNYVTKWNNAGGTQIGNSLVYDDGTNVGIGTTGPQTKIHIRGSDGAVASFPTIGAKDWFIIENNGNSNMALIGSNTSSTGYKFQDSGASTWSGIVNYDHTNDALWFGTNGTEKVRIDSSGNVGIGTTNPGASLTVGNNTFQVNSSGNLIKVNNVVYSWPSGQGGSGTVLGNDGSGGLTWASTATAGGWTDDVTNVYLATTSDRVGIGTTAPNVKLHVVGDGTYSAAFMSGNVGIGTTSPQATNTAATLLELAGSTTGAEIVLSSGLNSANRIEGINFRNSDAETTTPKWFIGRSTYSSLNKDTLAIVEDHNITNTRMVIQSGGNVGIGTTSPGSALDVKGTLRLSGSTSGYVGLAPAAAAGSTTYTLPTADGSSGYVLSTNGSGTLSWTSAASGTVTGSGTQNYMTKWNNAGGTQIGNSLVYDNGTNVGIGTTSPNAPLAVIDTANSGGYINWGGSAVRGTLSYSSASSYLQIGSNSNYPLRIITNSADRMTIDTSGNVGIGTTSPGVKLDIVGTHVSGVGIARFKGDAGNGFLTLDSATAGESGFLVSNAGTLIGQFGARAGDNAVYIKNRVYGTTEVMTISSGGNVGIGTTGPGYKLDVVSNKVMFGADNGAPTTRTTATAKYGSIVIPHYTNTELPVSVFYGYAGSTDNGLTFGGGNGDENSATYVRFYTGATNTTPTGTERMRIINNGNVGIGTTNPLQKLQVAGDINIESGSGLRINNTATSTQYLRGDGTRFVSSAIQSGDLPAITSAGGWTDGGTNVYLTTTTDSVGIGTTSPGTTLDVRGNVTLLAGSDIRPTANSTTALNIANASGADFVTFDTTNSRVGIGTTGPGYKLDVTGTFRNTDNSFIGPVTPGYPFQSSLTWQSDNTGYYYGFGYQKNDGTNKKLQVWWIDTALETNINSVLNVATPGHTFDGTAPNSGRTIGASIAASGTSYFNGGNVGIGTTAPDSKLTLLTPSGYTGNLLGFKSLTEPTAYNMTMRADSISSVVRYVFDMTNAGTAYNSVLTLDRGNVGIGTTSPGTLLSVGSNTFQVDSSGNLVKVNNVTYSWPGANASGVLTNNGSGTLSWGALASAGGWTDGGTNVYLTTSTDNVGIGITSPLGRLDVAGATARSGTHATTPSFYVTGTMNTGLTGPASGNVEFRHDNGTQGIGFGYQAIYATGSAANQPLHIQSRGTSALSLNGVSAYSTGNVGIGTTGPAQKLDVAGNINLSGATSNTIFFGTTGVAPPGASSAGEKIQLYGTSGTIAATDYALGIESSTLWFNTASQYKWYIAGAPYMMMLSSGNLGIGTTNPLQKLQVAGDVNVESGSGLRINNTATSGQYLRGDGTRFVSSAIQSGDLPAITSAGGWTDGGTNVYLTTSTDNVGIGTTGPNAKLSFGTAAGDNVLYLYDAASDKYGFGIRSSQFMIYSGAGGVSTGGITFGKFDGTTFTEAMRIQNGGNVGIGTTGPGSKLEIVGGGTGVKTLLVKGNTSSDANIQEWQTSAGVSYAQVTSNQDLLFKTGRGFTLQDTSDTRGIKIDYNYDSTGSSGSYINFRPINSAGGTSGFTMIPNGNPSTGSTMFLYGTDYLGDATNYFRANVAINTTRFQLITQKGGTGVLKPIVLEADGTATYDQLFLATDGNVGIGTTSPGAKLHVSSGFSILNDAASATNRNYGPVLWTDKGFGMELGYTGNWGTRIFTRTASENISFGWQSGSATLQSDYIEWMRLVNGNVGIGTTSPNAKLEVKGSSRFSFSAEPANYYLNLAEQDNGAANVSWNLTQLTGGTTYNVLSFKSGNVGIGTTSPQSLLHINGASAANYGHLALQGNASGDSNVAYMSFYDSASTRIGFFGDGSAANDDLYLTASTGDLRFGSAGTSSQMVLQSGNVGIGTTAPGSALDVKGTLRLSGSTSGYVGLAPAAAAGSTTYTLPSADGSSGQVLSTSGSGTLSWTTAAGSGTVTGSGTQNYMTKWNNAGGTQIGNSLVYDDGTNVGIGTTGPGAALEVKASADATIPAIIEGNSATQSANLLQVKKNSGATPLVVVDSSGQVGIGTTGPAALLEVSGGAAREKITSTTNDANAALYFNAKGASGTVRAGGLFFKGDETAANSFISLSGDNANYQLNVMNSGNVGIGTTTPTGKLQIGQAATAGTAIDYLRVIGSPNSGNSNVYIKSEWADVDAAKGDLLRLENFTGVKMVVDYKGNVGIGTTNPVQPLHIYSDNVAPLGGQLAIESSSTAKDVGMVFVTGGNTKWSLFRPANSASFRINCTEVGHNQDYLTILDTGYVGIGTTGPGSALDVKGTLRLSGSTSGYVGLAPAAAAGSTTYTLPSADGSGGQVLSTNGSATLSWTTISTGTIGGSGTTNYMPKFTASTTLGNSLIYDNGTNVGIGTTGPIASLHVGNGAGALLWTGFKGLFSDSSDARIATAVGNKAMLLRTTSTYGSLSGYDYAGALIPLSLQEFGGNVGIGTTSPGANLEVYSTTQNPSIRVRDEVTSASGGGIFKAYHNNTSVGLPASGDRLGGLLFGSFDGSTDRATASIEGGANENWVTGASAGSYLRFSTVLNGTVTPRSERMRIDSAGNVGIGTTGPQKKLHIVGPEGAVASFPSGPMGTRDVLLLENNQNVNMSFVAGSGYQSNIRFLKSGDTSQSGALIYYHASDSMAFNTAAAERVRIDSSGNVGIGTTTPGAKLEVNGTVKITDGTQGTGKVLTSDVNGLASWAAAGTGTIGGSGATNYISKFTPNGTTLGNSLIYDDGTNVGIGTTSPGQILDISTAQAFLKMTSTTGTNRVGLYVNNTGGTAYTALEGSAGGGWITGTSAYSAIYGQSNDYPVHLVQNNAVRMTIGSGSSAGNVGIGTTSPAVKLDLVGGSMLIDNAQYYRGRDSGGTSRSLIGLSASDVVTIGTAGLSTSDTQILAGGVNPAVTIKNTSGNVGIGTTSPGYKLEVNGNSYFGSTLNTPSFVNMRGMQFSVGGVAGTNLRWDIETAGAESGGNAGSDYYVYRYNDTGGYLGNPFSIKRSTGDATFNGNVGIGTTGPLTGLHLKKTGVAALTTTTGAAAITVETDTLNTYPGIWLKTLNSGSNGYAGIMAQNVNTYDAELAFLTDPAGGPVERMRITRLGNVGIGTMGPTLGKLQVGAANIAFAAGDSANVIIATTNAIATDMGGTLGLGGVDTGGTIATYAVIKGADEAGAASNAGYLAFGTRTHLAYATERMRITSTGNVGIGTTNPLGKLDVNGTIYQRGAVLHADYVFKPGYKLESIDEHSKYMWQEKHLKAVPKAKKDEQGQDIVEIGAMNKGVLEELEKAHVYIQQLNERMKVLEMKLSKLEAK